MCNYRKLLPYISLVFDTERVIEPHRYNTLTANEIAYVFKNDNGGPPADRDIKAYPKNLNIPLHSTDNSISDLIIIDTMMNICEPMTYPLLYPYGDLGWDKYLIQTSNDLD